MGHAFQTAERGRSRSHGRPASDAPRQVHHVHAPSARLQRAPSCACGGSCPRCAATSSLTVGPADDQYEREADRVADAVMSGRGGAPAAIASGTIRRAIYRQAMFPPEAAYDSAMPEEGMPEETPGTEEPEVVQRSAIGGAGAVTPHYERSLNQAIGRGGARLPATTRSFMENRLGSDLSSVRVHSDGEADTLARQVNARAFTLGRDIFFAKSEYAPSTPAGQRLLAHELTHVIQQSDGRLSRQIQRTRCTAYPGYDASVDRLTYNCAGLAMRTYRNTFPASKAYTEMEAEFDTVYCPAGDCAAGEVKFWVWEYDMHIEDPSGTVLELPHPDFHMVGGRMTSSGGNPSVYSKNGKRPIHGPASGSSFKPAAKEQSLDVDDNPVFLPDGRAVYKVRRNMSEIISCGDCR